VRHTVPRFCNLTLMPNWDCEAHNSTMNIKDLFKSNEEKAKLSQLSNLLKLALADGKFDETEKVAIATFFAENNNSEADLNRVLSNPNSISFVAPTNNAERIKYLKQLIALMIIDGNIDDNEMKYCHAAAIKLGFKPEAVEMIISDIISNLAQQTDE
jgi:uncharacterized membrane protein YebE (DUF533 family)